MTIMAGGVVDDDARWVAYARNDARIAGPCQSDYTGPLGHIPRQRICVTPEASFGFHLVRCNQHVRPGTVC